jgi:hypothetical protein
MMKLSDASMFSSRIVQGLLHCLLKPNAACEQGVLMCVVAQ